MLALAPCAHGATPDTISFPEPVKLEVRGLSHNLWLLEAWVTPVDDMAKVEAIRNLGVEIDPAEDNFVLSYKIKSAEYDLDSDTFSLQTNDAVFTGMPDGTYRIHVMLTRCDRYEESQFCGHADPSGTLFPYGSYPGDSAPARALDAYLAASGKALPLGPRKAPAGEETKARRKRRK